MNALSKFTLGIGALVKIVANFVFIVQPPEISCLLFRDARKCENLSFRLVTANQKEKDEQNYRNESRSKVRG